MRLTETRQGEDRLTLIDLGKAEIRVKHVSGGWQMKKKRARESQSSCKSLKD